MKYNSEYELSKTMLNAIRNSELLSEGVNEVVEPSELDYTDEVKKFKSQISSRVEITTFNIYPESNNVVFGGVFNDVSSLHFEMSLSEKDGLYINADNLQITDDIVNRIQKLNGYYKNWSEEWANKVISDYKNKN